jgi:glutamate--cysteine ligase
MMDRSYQIDCEPKAVKSALNITEFSNSSVLKALLRKGFFGLEKEQLRATQSGKLALTPHPPSLGNKAEHPYITTDFSESQIEMITPPLPSVEEAHGFLKTLHAIVEENMPGDEILWPQSMPPELPDEDKIPVADFRGPHVGKRHYREKLSDKYGKTRQMMSGIHFNFSFSDQLIEALKASVEATSEEIEEEVYLKVLRNLLRNRWLLVALFGRSPKSDPSFKLKSLDSDEWLSMCCHSGVSIRSSSIGYRNTHPLDTSYCCLEDYHRAVNKQIANGQIQNPAELYLPIRIKMRADNKRISHLEIRPIDLDPFDPIGISIEAVRFLRMLILYSLLSEDLGPVSVEEQTTLEHLQHQMACCGLKDMRLSHQIDSDSTGLELSRELLSKIESAMDSLGELEIEENKAAIVWAKSILEDAQKHPASTMIRLIDEKGYIDANLELRNAHPKATAREAFTFFGFQDLELSTQLLLREAVQRGVRFSFLDRGENFITLHKTGKTEHIMQATRTSLDPYNSVLVMTNKTVTKKVLSQAGIRVPGGSEYNQREEALGDFWRYEGSGIVVKPKSTNFGLGITIFDQHCSFDNYQTAVNRAFQEDRAILVEQFVSGDEYRFFLIDAQVVAVLRRIPANVVGNGKNTIEELVGIKNQDPLRGKGYRTPLEFLNLGEVEIEFLMNQGLNPQIVPGQGVRVFLRENSNISTGGDSVDYTERIHHSYFELASKAAKAVGARITGLDMMIDDISSPAGDDNYAVIELNFNPAIHIHCFPLEGKPRPLQKMILNRLGFV